MKSSKDTVKINAQTLRAIKTLTDDIAKIDERADCSDKFFRHHFMDTVKAFRATGIIDEINKALEQV